MLNLAAEGRQIRKYTSRGNFRIFDFVNGNRFIEVKNVKILNNTQQLRDMLEIVKTVWEEDPSTVFELYIRVGEVTELSESLQDLIASYGDMVKVLREIPPPYTY